MQFNPSKPAVWVNTQGALNKIAPALIRGPYLAVDTESNSLFAYHEQVCLIQFSTADTDYLIDGLAGLDLSPLKKIFTDTKIQKIFHAAEYDVVCLKRDFGFAFENLFDTMQAARILGFQQLGLSALLEGQFRLEPVKSFQKANWGKRPLNAEMKQYARVDTHYLIPLRERLAAQLEKNGLMELAEEDFRRVSKVENNHLDHSSYAQISGYHKLSPQELAVLDALCAFRDKTAKKQNRPLFKVIVSKALLEAAQTMPDSMEALENIEGFSSRLVKRYGRDVLIAVKKGKNARPIILEKRKRPSNAFVKRVDALKKWRKEKGVQMRVQSDVVLPRDILEMIAGKKPEDKAGLRKAMVDVPWRYAHFSDEIMNVIIKGS